MKGKAVVIVTGAALLGLTVLASRRGKSMHERCKEACARMAGEGSSAEDESDSRCGPPTEEGEARNPCGPAACRK